MDRDYEWADPQRYPRENYINCYKCGKKLYAPDPIDLRWVRTREIISGPFKVSYAYSLGWRSWLKYGKLVFCCPDCLMEEDKKFEITPDRSMMSNLQEYKKFISEAEEKYYV